MTGLLVVLAIVALAFGLMVRSARRHAAAKEASGEWDSEGPKHPTAPPDDKMGYLRRVTGRNWPRL